MIAPIAASVASILDPGECRTNPHKNLAFLSVRRGQERVANG